MSSRNTSGPSPTRGWEHGKRVSGRRKDDFGREIERWRCGVHEQPADLPGRVRAKGHTYPCRLGGPPGAPRASSASVQTRTWCRRPSPAARRRMDVRLGRHLSRSSRRATWPKSHKIFVAPPVRLQNTAVSCIHRATVSPSPPLSITSPFKGKPY
jgi:hypothetical protein